VICWTQCLVSQSGGRRLPTLHICPFGCLLLLEESRHFLKGLFVDLKLVRLRIVVMFNDSNVQDDHRSMLSPSRLKAMQPAWLLLLLEHSPWLLCLMSQARRKSMVPWNSLRSNDIVHVCVLDIHRTGQALHSLQPWKLLSIYLRKPFTKCCTTSSHESQTSWSSYGAS
jgi:hypothetical protein